jgi:hypothetical protein
LEKNRKRFQEDSVAEKVREEAKKIVAEQGEVLMSSLISEIAKRLGKKGLRIRTDFALSSIASTAGLELRVTPVTGVKKIRIISKKSKKK